MKSAIFLAILLISVSHAQPKYEFRGAWIASVDNIDWPNRGTITPQRQREQFTELLEMHARNGINAVIVQIRPATDAFYPSQYEPWSQWLTGKQGMRPTPYYDPLQFMIEETHKRGMEFHAWCNPYRADFKLGATSIAPAHITRIHPEWFVTYGDKRYFDPGNRQAQQFVVQVIGDIVKRYDVDALHFDDYFYPYRIAGLDFPDTTSFHEYGTGMTRDDWRRSNVDSIIVMLNRAIKREKPFCRFGISPFGVWRNRDKDPRGSDTRAGQTNYDDLYADILLWLERGWIDYVAPQLYWEFGHRAAPYEKLVDWWSKNTFGKHCYIGLGIYRAGSSGPWKDSTMLPRQIASLRLYPEIQGAIYFSSKSFTGNPNGWNDSLRNNYYKYPALVPPMDWVDNYRPPPPEKVEAQFNNELLSLKADIPTIARRVKAVTVYASTNLALVMEKHPAALVKIIPTNKKVAVEIPIDLGHRGWYVSAALLTTTNQEGDIGNIIHLRSIAAEKHKTQKLKNQIKDK